MTCMRWAFVQSAALAVALASCLGVPQAHAQFGCVGNSDGSTVGLGATACDGGHRRWQFRLWLQANAAGTPGSGNTAIGISANASGNGSANVAAGNLAIANGDGSHNIATGNHANANGATSNNIATGVLTPASGSNSANSATGSGANASGTSSNNIANGTNANVSGNSVANSGGVTFNPANIATGNGANASDDGGDRKHRERHRHTGR